jgi:hypothetical protein
MQRDFLHQRSSTQDLNFNAKKYAAMRFSRKKSSVPPQDYHINDQPIKFSSIQSDRGNLVRNNLKWSLHINNLLFEADRILSST